MPAWLTWAALKSLPWGKIAAALGALVLLYGAYSWAWNRGSHSRDAEVAALTGTIANLKAASAKAKADNIAHVATVETKQDQVTKDHTNDAPNSIAIGNAAIAEYVRLHPAPKADPGSTGGAGLSQVPVAASQPDAAGTETIVPRSDLDACNIAYATAVGLQGWIRDQAAIAR